MHWTGLLRARRKRPGCRRAAEQRDELAPPCMSGTAAAAPPSVAKNFRRPMWLAM